MSQESSSSESIRQPPGQDDTVVAAVYLSIPLPPRERPQCRPELPSFRTFFRKVAGRWKARPLLPAHVKKKRVEFAQATGVALLANLFLALLLLTISIDSATKDDGLFFIAKAATDSESHDASAASAGANAPAVDDAKRSSAERGSIEVKTTVPPVVTAPSPLAVSPDLESFMMPDPTALMGQSISRTELAELNEQRRESVKDFVDSSGRNEPLWAKSGLGDSGIGVEVLGSIFKGDEMGNGSNAVVMLDISGSMKGVNIDVERYMEANFKEALVRHIPGCSMKRLTDPFASTLISESRHRERTDFYFVCDLRDGESEMVINAVRRFLNSGPRPRRLHLVSFDRAPGRLLSGLLSTSGNTLTMARALTPSSE